MSLPKSEFGAIADWLQLPTEGQLRTNLARVLTWAIDEFNREDLLPAALSQRFSFREPVPDHLIQPLEGTLSFIPTRDWKPVKKLVVFASTPDQFSGRLSLAHDYCIRHETQSVLLITDYFDNQAFQRPASTFESLNERNGVRLAISMYSCFGLTLLQLLDNEETNA